MQRLARGRRRCRGRRCRGSRRRSGARSPSRSTCCAARKRTSAWATVSGRAHAGTPAQLQVASASACVGARQPRGDDRAGGVGQPHRALERPALQQAVAPARRRTRRRRRGRRRRRSGPAGPRRRRSRVRDQHARRALLDDRDLDAELEQRVGGRVRVARADGDLDLFAVADGDGRVPQRLAGVAVASRASAQNIGRWSRSWMTRPRRARASSAASVAARLGSARQARCPSSRGRARRGSRRGRARRPRASCRARSARGRRAAGSRRAGGSRRTRAACAASGAVPTKRSSTPNSRSAPAQ